MVCKAIRSLSFAALVLLAVLVLTVPVVAPAGFRVIREPFMVSDPNNGEDDKRSVVAVDNQGNAHLLWLDGSGYVLLYAMFDPYGNELIAPTELLDGGESYKYRKPKLAIDRANCLHIVYHSEGAEVSYLKVDPYLDDRDGDEANPDTIIVVDPKTVSPDDGTQSVAPTIAAGSVHIVWRDKTYGSVGNLSYTRLDEDGNVEIGPTVLTDETMFPDYSNEPSIAVDSQGNVHIVWNDEYDTMETEIAYMMVDGSTGDVLIDTTFLTPDDDDRSRRPMIVADSQDRLHMVWQDRRTGTTEIYYTKINPYLDDLDGDSADESTITVIDDTMLSDDDGYKSKHPALAIDWDDRLSVIWWDEKWLDGDSELSCMLLNSEGNTLVGETRITLDGSNVEKYDDWFVPWVSTGGAGRIFITYTSTQINGDTEDEVWLTILEPPAAVGGVLVPVDQAQILTNLVTKIVTYLAALTAIIATGAAIVFKKRL